MSTILPELRLHLIGHFQTTLMFYTRSCICVWCQYVWTPPKYKNEDWLRSHMIWVSTKTTRKYQ